MQVARLVRTALRSQRPTAPHSVGSPTARLLSCRLSSLKVPDDATRDFAPISQVLAMASIVAVNNDLPVKTFKDLVAYAKARPGKLSYAHPRIGTPQHIGGELLKSIAGIDITQVPYRGALIADVLDGRVPITLQNMAAILPTVRDHKLRGLAVTSLERSAVIPELPTVAESGYPGYEATSWFALVAPAGTPAPNRRQAPR